MFFYHVLKSGQEGQVTRIASGCNDEATKDIQTIFDQQIKVMAPDRFHLHLTPDFSKIKQGYNFKYFNKVSFECSDRMTRNLSPSSRWLKWIRVLYLLLEISILQQALRYAALDARGTGVSRQSSRTR